MNAALSLLGVVTLVLCWQLAWSTGAVNTVLLPAPAEVGRALLHNLLTGSFWAATAMTLARSVVGFALATFLGIPLGLVVGYFPRVYQTLGTLIDFFRSLPATAMFPVFMLFFGIGDMSKIAVVVFACGLIVTVNTAYGVKNANPTRSLVAKILRASSCFVFFKVILPNAIPEVTAGLRISLSLSLVLVVVSEMFAGTSAGLGQMIYDMHLAFRIPQMYSAVAVTGVLGYGMNRLFLVWERRYVHWAGK